MKGKISWIISFIFLIVGFIFYFPAKLEIMTNSHYTWNKPYTKYESEVIMTKWIGIMLLVWGIIIIVLKILQLRYTNKHVKDINQEINRGGVILCSNCGLSISADTRRCPGCGNFIEPVTYNNNFDRKNAVNYCGKCGIAVNKGDVFCFNCGNKI